jgi:hypothetical protein
MLYNNDPGPGGVGTQHFDTILNQTDPVYDPINGSEIDPVIKEMTGKIKPALQSVTAPDKTGYCTANFYYDNTNDMILEILPCTGEALILDKNNNPVSGTSCPQPWNEFVGVGSGNYTFLSKDMGQPTRFLKNDESTLEARSLSVKFKNGIQWRLANAISDTAYCDSQEDTCSSCDPQETCLWGYMYYDKDNDGVKDSDESGFASGSVDISYIYKNQDKDENVAVNKVPSQTGLWKSDCIQMSGWALNITANLPLEYTTNNSYLNYNEKMTGQDKKNPPELDFAVVAKPTPEPATTVIPIDTGGVGAQLNNLDGNTDVIVEYAFSDAGYENVFSLSSPNTQTLGNSKSTPIGTKWNLGKFASGQELIFADKANGETYYSGLASKNPDKTVHGAITYIDGNSTYKKYLVTFEDFWQGGDKDYNDVEFYVSGNIMTSTDTAPPTVSGVTVSQNPTTKLVTIGWTASDDTGVSNIIIRLSDNGGRSYDYILLDSSWTTTPNQVRSDTFSWTPYSNYNSAKFKVVAYDGVSNTGSAESSLISISKKTYKHGPI